MKTLELGSSCVTRDTTQIKLFFALVKLFTERLFAHVFQYFPSAAAQCYSFSQYSFCRLLDFIVLWEAFKLMNGVLFYDVHHRKVKSMLDKDSKQLEQKVREEELEHITRYNSGSLLKLMMLMIRYNIITQQAKCNNVITQQT